MTGRGGVWGFCICLFCVAVLLGAELGARRHGALYYLPERNFWRLGSYTNLAGQFDGKEKFILRHTGVPFDEEVFVEKPAGVIRIIALGTSSTEGFRVLKKNNFSSQLQRSLEVHYGRGKVEVINAAVGGYVSYQLLVYFQEVLLKLSPDIVILYLAHNDSSLNGPFSARDYYERVKKAFAGLGNNDAKKERLFKYGLNGLNPLYPFLAESRLFGYFLIKISEKFFQKKHLSPPVDREYVLREFVALSRRYNFRMIFAPEIVREWSQRAVRPYYFLMKNIAEKENIPFVNMTLLLREHSDNMVFLNGNDVVHLKPFGHQLVAAELFEQVMAMIDRPQTCKALLVADEG